MALEKYDIDHPWMDVCLVCSHPLEMTCARYEVLGTYCDGCFGWPVCDCKESHVGDCLEEIDE